MMRKLICLALCLCLILCNTMVCFGEMEVKAGYEQPAVEDLLEVTLKIHSNVTNMTELEGLYFDNVFYIDYAAVCELTGCLTKGHDSAQVIYSMHGGLRQIKVTEDCRLAEKYGKDNFAMDIPTATFGGELYVSAPHILRYMGASVDFAVDADAQTHMTVSMPYTILDLYEEYQDANGYTFYWSEAEGEFVDPEIMQYFAVMDTVYWSYDSHLAIQGVFWDYSELVMEELYRDVVLEVVRTSGAELVSQESPVLALFGGVSGEILVGEAWIEGVMAVANFEGAESLIDDILSQGEYVFLDDVSGAAKVFVKLTGGMASALETVKQYSGVNDAQAMLLPRTLNRIVPGGTYYDIAPDIIDAADMAQMMINDEQLAAERSAKKMLFDLAVDAITSKIPIVSTVSSATEIMTTVIQHSKSFQEFLDMETCITVASVANTIALVARNILKSDYPRVNIHVDRSTTYQEYIKADMLLSLKGSILTRQQLIKSGALVDYSQESLERTNQNAAQLLNRAENAQVVKAMKAPVVEEDLTWIAKLAGKGLMGMAVDTGRHIYYWQYDPEQYASGALLGNFSKGTTATLVRVDRKGNEEAIFTGAATEFVVTAANIFYGENGTICSRNMDGSGYRQWVSGTICAVDSYGQNLVYQCDGVYYGLDTWSGETIQLFENGAFEACHNGVVYYSVPIYETEFEAAQNGKVILRAVNMDGTNDRMMVTTPADLDSDPTFSAATIQQIHFGKEGVYFSYGCIAGTGMFFQGGKIVRVSYDGTDVEVMAGEDELVDANFGVREDGSVCTSTDMDFIFYNDQEDYYVWENTLYWMDQESGMAQELLSTDRYASDVSCEVCYVAWVSAFEDKTIFMVDFCNLDPEQAFGWREYAVRVQSVVYELDMKSGDLEQLYTF